MKTKHAPYSLYRKRIGDKKYWYVRFWNPQTRTYAVHRATGIEAAGQKERRSEAERAASEMLSKICPSAVRMNVVDYLESFWDNGSPYFKELAGIRKKEISGRYIHSARGVIRLHIAPYRLFHAIKPDGLTAGVIRDFMLWLKDRGLSGSRINRVIQAVRIPFRYALSRDEVQSDPFTKIRAAPEGGRLKGALTKDEASALIEAPVKDTRRRLAVLLGLLSGMRMGEARGLCWEDIDPDAGVIHLKNNWQDMDGLKGPKCGSAGDVPFPRQTAGVLEAYRKERGFPSSGLVFAREKDGKPCCHSYFGIMFATELEEAAGIKGKWRSRKPEPEGYVDEQKERNLTFHSLRHTFVSMARLAGINDFEVQAMARHKSRQMMDRYSHPEQVVEIGGCRERLEGFFERRGAL